MDERENMNQYIIETTTEMFVFYALIEAENVQEAIEIKTNSVAIGSGTVTGATRHLSKNQEYHWGEPMRNVELTPPQPVKPKYTLTNRS